MAAGHDPSASGAPLLDVRDLTVAFNGRAAIDGISFSVGPGEIVGLLGESGSGKSTAAYAMLGLVKAPGEIVAGEVRLEGQDLLSMPAHQLRDVRGGNIGLIVQNPRSALHPMLRVGRQIGEAWRAHNEGTGSDARRRALEMLQLVGINDPERRLDAFAHELSGGMAQRVLIAMALSSMPKLLVADEPTSGLDVTIQAQFLDQMWQTVRSTNSSVLLVTQDDGVIANYCDRVIVLENGRIVDQDDTRSYFARTRNRQTETKARGSGTEATPRGDTAPLLEVSGLSKHFAIANSDKKVHAVSDFDLKVMPGETLGLVGESGSGKSTVGRSIIRLFEVSSGSVVFDRKDVHALRPAELKALRARMQIVLQDPYDSVDLRWTIEKILSEPLDVHRNLSKAEKRARVEELMALVDLDPGMLERRPRDLGAGALQRVNIARSLATDPEFVILDEPTSVLAPAARSGLIALLRRLQSELGLAFLFISHDLTTVSEVCDRVVVMYLSQIVEIGTTEEVFGDPKHPYTKALIASHLSPDVTNRRVDRVNQDTLAGEIPSPIDLPKGCYLYSRCTYRLDRCVSEPQKLLPDGEGRMIRCWRAREDARLQPLAEAKTPSYA
ncbi:ABC transporter ATP-binding protein [Jiella mangrovi]|uniref:ABC transporter ATP-binding protein n=1 Tax=Jiella mangrovi TaxID=2821407 RepID=A0ABS4BIL0_9HYPH|nr:ABC transporter ATP-binding protein [Jiella mangrovi]MBP0615800.1 ABC transporter ATP-binding protein [Jiella mangrovi]